MRTRPYKCSRCRRRHWLTAKGLDKFKCSRCGYRRCYFEKRARQQQCTCDGYHFTHRHGSLNCIHHRDYEFNVRVRAGENPDAVRAAIEADHEFATFDEAMWRSISVKPGLARQDLDTWLEQFF